MGKRVTKATKQVKTPSETIDNIVLGIDPGNARTKIEGTADISLNYRSIYSLLPKATMLSDYPPDAVFTFNGQSLCFGEEVYTYAPEGIQERVDEGRYLSDWYKNLFAASLHKSLYKLQGRTIKPKIVSSIPAMMFKNEDLRDAIKEHLTGEYELKNTLGGSIVVQVEDLLIVPEGMGAYWNIIFSDDPSVNIMHYTQGTWMILDLGYLSLDAVFVRDGKYMPTEAQSDARVGVSLVAEAVRDYIQVQTKTRLPQVVIDDQLSANEITVNRKPIQIKDVRDSKFREIGSRMVDLSDVWGRGKNVEGIILMGGQSPHVKTFMKGSKYQIEVARNCRVANALGQKLYGEEAANAKG